ncbi:MAG: hypothetical protein HQK53_00385 [Oligoflexia bacterium]|nr:hypothetical protein [Oligoflexia bacterium]
MQQHYLFLMTYAVNIFILFSVFENKTFAASAALDIESMPSSSSFVSPSPLLPSAVRMHSPIGWELNQSEESKDEYQTEGSQTEGPQIEEPYINDMFKNMIADYLDVKECNNKNTTFFFDIDGTIMEGLFQEGVLVTTDEVNGSVAFLQQLRESLSADKLAPQILGLTFRPYTSVAQIAAQQSSGENARLTRFQMDRAGVGEFFYDPSGSGAAETIGKYIQLIANVTSKIAPPPVLSSAPAPAPASASLPLPKGEIGYHRGVFYTAEVSKGVFLEEYMRLFPEKKCLFFVDDNKTAASDAAIVLGDAVNSEKIYVGNAYLIQK